MGRIDIARFILAISERQLVGLPGINEPGQLLLQMDADCNSSLHIAALCGYDEVRYHFTFFTQIDGKVFN
jgi:hypothetical protein